MAAATIKGGGWFAIEQMFDDQGTPAFADNNFYIDGASESFAFIVQAPKTGNIRTVGWRARKYTGGSGLVDLRLETIGTGGDPSGTLVGTTTNVTFAGTTITDQAWNSHTLTLDAAVTKGQKFAVRWVNPASLQSDFGIQQMVETSAVKKMFPYTYHSTGGRSSNPPVLALGYDDGTYEYMPGVCPYSAINSTAYNSGSSPDEYGLIFQVPFPCRLRGIWALCDLSGQDTTIKVYDSDGSTVLSDLAFDKDFRRTTGVGRHLFMLEDQPSLAKATNYRVTFVPDSTTNITLIDVSVNAAAIMDAMPGGQNWHLTSRTDAGSWTQTTTRRPLIGLLLDQFDDGVGGGGPVAIQRIIQNIGTY